MLTAMLLAATGAQAQKSKTDFTPANLQGIWQLCHYVSESVNSTGALRPSFTFKVLNEGGTFNNFTVIPGSSAIITGSGNWEQLTDDSYKEITLKNIHLPQLDMSDLILYFEIEDDEILHLRYYIKEDADGNIIEAWYHETWKRVIMPDKFPDDITR